MSTFSDGNFDCVNIYFIINLLAGKTALAMELGNMSSISLPLVLE